MRSRRQNTGWASLRHWFTSSTSEEKPSRLQDRGLSARRRPMRLEPLEPRMLLASAALFPPLAASPADSAVVMPPLQTASPLGSSSPGGAFSPQQIQAAYGINLLSQNGAGRRSPSSTPTTTRTWSAAARGYSSSDLHNFDAYYGLPDFGGSGPTFTKLDQNGGTNYPATQSGGSNWEWKKPWTWNGHTPSRRRPTSS